MVKEGTLQCLGKFLDYSIRGGKTKPKRRYYIHIKDPDVAESPEFPFQPNDLLMIRVKGNKLEVLKVEMTVRE